MADEPMAEVVLHIRVKVHAVRGRELPSAEEIKSDLTDQCIDMLHYQHKDANEHIVVVSQATRAG